MCQWYTCKLIVTHIVANTAALSWLRAMPAAKCVSLKSPMRQINAYIFKGFKKKRSQGINCKCIDCIKCGEAIKYIDSFSLTHIEQWLARSISASLHRNSEVDSPTVKSIYNSPSRIFRLWIEKNYIDFMSSLHFIHRIKEVIYIFIHRLVWMSFQITLCYCGGFPYPSGLC